MRENWTLTYDLKHGEVFVRCRIPSADGPFPVELLIWSDRGLAHTRAVWRIGRYRHAVHAFDAPRA